MAARKTPSKNARKRTPSKAGTSAGGTTGAADKRAGPRTPAARPGRKTVDKPAAKTRRRGGSTKASAEAVDASTSPAALMTMAQGQARTVIYVHGIGNKPPAEVLRRQWDNALFGRGMGERTRMAYWVNRVRYPTPEPGTAGERDEGPILNQAEARVLTALGLDPAQRNLDELADEIADSERERLLLQQMLAELEVSAPLPGSPAAKGVAGFLNRALLKMISAALLQDVHDFFFVKARREAMRQSLKERMNAGGGPFVVVAHSQGSMIAYDVLRELAAEQYEVALFVTLGSPLGLPSVRSMFKQWSGKRKLQFPACVRRWVNVADHLDPVALDEDLGNDIAGANGRFVNVDGARINPDWQQNPHSGSGYLSIPQVRKEVRDVVGVGFDQPVSNTVLLKDLSDRLEAMGPAHRHDVLIELDKLALDGEVDQVRAALLARIRQLARQTTGLSGEQLDDVIELEDSLHRFVSARLTRFEVETLRNDYQQLSFKRLWRDAAKSALLNQSRSVIHADAAQASYHALGQKIGWAVLDTGIAADHPHFHSAGQHDVVLAQWDCTRRGKAKKLQRGDGEVFARMDRNGHGTHVAGIIAGQCIAPIPGQPDPLQFCGIAPQASLYGFKVLDDNGNGRDSWIIKAVQQVAEINEQAGQLVIHGINLSLGGYFDVESYGCGFTPLCNELRRLWRQGVVVVLAAGNEGLAWLVQSDGQPYPLNVDLSIGDPANLEEAIAVGSVHKSNPHSYGVSYFSSRGPTADGRGKPDVVAPGEKIISAHYDFRADDPGTWVVEMSGTSMAAPHVSGLVAGFLSVRREFIGFPDRVKQLLLQHATDIGRDAYAQGRGVPNLMQMLAAT